MSTGLTNLGLAAALTAGGTGCDLVRDNPSFQPELATVLSGRLDPGTPIRANVAFVAGGTQGAVVTVIGAPKSGVVRLETCADDICESRGASFDATDSVAVVPFPEVQAHLGDTVRVEVCDEIFKECEQVFEGTVGSMAIPEAPTQM